MPYPLISLVNRLPQDLQGQSQLNFHTRTFETFSLTFKKDYEASEVFESVKELTVASELYSFIPLVFSDLCCSFCVTFICILLLPDSPLSLY